MADGQGRQGTPEVDRDKQIIAELAQAQTREIIRNIHENARKKPGDQIVTKALLLILVGPLAFLALDWLLPVIVREAGINLGSLGLYGSVSAYFLHAWALVLAAFIVYFFWPR